MQTFLEFKARLRSEMWPTGEPARLRIAHDPFFNEAMMDLQRWVPCLKQFNISTWEFADTYWENAKTVVNAPWGKIRRVYTVAGGLDRWRDKVSYRSSTYPIIQCWANTLIDAITPDDGLPQLTFGNHRADASGDSPYGRARIGIWAVDRKRLYLAPYIQSTEMIVVDWDGEKNKWQDSDGVDETYWTVDVEEAVKYYVLFKHELLWGDRGFAKDLKTLYDGKLADLMFKCNEFTKQQYDHTCDAAGGGQDFVGLSGPGGSNITDDDDDPVDDPTEDEVLFDAVGDMGEDNENAADVAAAIAGDNPELFIALGDNSYHGDYAADFGVNYQDFVDAGTVLPVAGNHDWDVGSDLDAFNEYFGETVVREKIIGPIEFFAYDTDSRNPYGYDANSEQAEWLRLKMLLSVARWKIVVLHRSPFVSDATHPSDTDLQLDFAGWGADLVISGHSHLYERLSVSGLPYIVVGTGGRPLYSFGTPVSGSLVRIANAFGRLIGNANCDELTLQFKSVDQEVLDSLVLTKQ